VNGIVELHNNTLKSNGMSEGRKTVLLIEDEAGIADTIVYALQAESFHVRWKTLGSEGVAVVENEPVHLVILDVGLPDISGFEVCKQIRTTSDVPIIFLTARGDEVDRIVGLEIGADDYVTKPFSPRELVARVKVILRRSVAISPRKNSTDSLFILDDEKRLILYCGVALNLTRYEYGILHLLAHHPQRVYSREQLKDAVWHEPQVSFDRAVDTQIKTLRAKLHAINPHASPLITHRGIGYSLQIRCDES